MVPKNYMARNILRRNCKHMPKKSGIGLRKPIFTLIMIMADMPLKMQRGWKRFLGYHNPNLTGHVFISHRVLRDSEFLSWILERRIQLKPSSRYHGIYKYHKFLCCHSIMMFSISQMTRQGLWFGLIFPSQKIRPSTRSHLCVLSVSNDPDKSGEWARDICHLTL